MLSFSCAYFQLFGPSIELYGKSRKTENLTTDLSMRCDFYTFFARCNLCAKRSTQNRITVMIRDYLHADSMHDKHHRLVVKHTTCSFTITFCLLFGFAFISFCSEYFRLYFTFPFRLIVRINTEKEAKIISNAIQHVLFNTEFQ